MLANKATHETDVIRQVRPSATITDHLHFNRRHMQHVKAILAREPYRWLELREVLQETERLYLVWDTARDAWCEQFYSNVRRQSLKKLRDLIGAEGYYAGRIPAHVLLRR